MHSIKGWVSPRAGIDYKEYGKVLPVLELDLQSLGLPARSQASCCADRAILVVLISSHTLKQFLPPRTDKRPRKSIYVLEYCVF
jgi:hypothetical protein